MPHATIKSGVTPAWVGEQTDAQDGIASVGGLGCKINVQSPQISDASLLTLAKFIELTRRERGQSSKQLANEAGVHLEDVVALENGLLAGPNAHVIESVARALQLDSRPLLELAGFRAASNSGMADAAVEFAAHVEAVKPLEASERNALEWLRAHALKR